MTETTGLPTLMELLGKSATWLEARGITNARRETEWIFAETLGLSRINLYTRHDMPIESADVTRLRALVSRRGKREPLAYVLGNQPFRQITLTVTPAVLVPRPETEELVGLVLTGLPPGARVLDLGTGSGAIACALKHERADLQVEATDASADALAVARANAERLGLAIAFHHGHLATHLDGGWHRIVANLPYIGENQRHRCDPELAFEPALALYSGSDGLNLITELVADTPRLLAPGGQLWLEHADDHAGAITGLATAANLVAQSHRDGAGKDRFTEIHAP